MTSRPEQPGEYRRLEDLSEVELAMLDERLAAHKKASSRAFSETALSGMIRGVPGLLTARQIELNEQARQQGLEPAKGGEE